MIRSVGWVVGRAACVGFCCGWMGWVSFMWNDEGVVGQEGNAVVLVQLVGACVGGVGGWVSTLACFLCANRALAHLLASFAAHLTSTPTRKRARQPSPPAHVPQTFPGGAQGLAYPTRACALFLGRVFPDTFWLSPPPLGFPHPSLLLLHSHSHSPFPPIHTHLGVGGLCLLATRGGKEDDPTTCPDTDIPLLHTQAQAAMSDPATIAPPTVLSPMRAPTSCFPMLFGGLAKARQQRHSRAKTMDTVQTYKKELAAAAAQQQQAEDLPATATAAAAQGTPAQVDDTKTTTGVTVAATRGTSLRRQTFADARTLQRASTTVGRFTQGTPLSPVLSPGLDESESTAAKEEKGREPAPLGLIPCESEDLSCAASSPPGPVVVAASSTTTTTVTTTTSSTLTLTASITTTQTTTTTVTSPVPVPVRRAPVRSQSMGSAPRVLSGAASKPALPPTGNDRFYHPALRRSGSKSLAGSSSFSSATDGLDSSGPIPSLGALRDRFSSRRKSFSRLSRRLSMDELVEPREDYVYQPLPSAPALPVRLLPMISNGMARLAINMKDCVLTPATWEVVLSLVSPEDAAKITRYRFDKDRRLSLGSQLLQRAVIAWTFGVPYPTIAITRTEKGKPFYKPSAEALLRTPFPNWNYNVSHHGDFVGIASEPVCLVGLDIMNAKVRFSSFHALSIYSFIHSFLLSP